MTVSTTGNSIAYDGDGISKTFPIPFEFIASSDIDPYVNGVLLATGWSTTGGNGETGSITFVSAPAAGTDNVVILRSTDLLQNTDLPSNGKFPADSVERAIDKITLIAQDNVGASNRAIKLPASANAEGFDVPYPLSPLAVWQNKSDGSGIQYTTLDGTAGTLRPDLAASTGTSLVGYSRANTYAAGTVGNTLKQSAWVTDAPYNAKVDGTTDDTAAFLAALTDAQTVYVPAGTMLITSLAVPTGRTVIGVGRNATVIKQKNTTNLDMITLASVSDVEFRDLTLDGNKANNLVAGSGVRASGTTTRVYFRNVLVKNWRVSGVVADSGTSEIEAHNCRFDGCQLDGFSCTTVDAPFLNACTFVNQGRYGAVYGSGCTNIREASCRFKSNAQGGSIAVGGSDAIRIGSLYDTNGTGHGAQYNGTIRGVYVANISKANGISGYDFTGGANYGAAIGNISYLNTIRGMEIDSASYYVNAIGNIIYRNAETGLSVYRSPSYVLVGNYSGENGSGGSNKYGIRIWDDLNTLPSSNGVLIGNNATDDRGGSATQTVGLSVEAASTTGTRVIGNKLDNNITSAISAVAGSINSAQYNLGWTTRNQGTAVIPSGSTTVTIAHGMSVTPITEDFQIVLTSGPTNAVDLPWITAIDATNFTVNVRTNPGAGGLNFRWKCRRY